MKITIEIRDSLGDGTDAEIATSFSFKTSPELAQVDTTRALNDALNAIETHRALRTHEHPAFCGNPLCDICI